ncbi:GM13400 [Drosophila sechellia]|uniref:GM13400 n=1 Tax=Drosophila sechellia TaxID=7238 RepID=B4IF81_DROSE|nr:GM13400 [Drosophila sechellia]
MSTQQAENEESAAAKSKRPSDSAFKQQRLPAWQPVLTARTVLPTFFVIGVLFIPIGVVLLHLSNTANELIIDYTKCRSSGGNTTCAEYLEAHPGGDCTCQVPFVLPSDFNGVVYMYYGLTNYYQNHRRYVKSRDDEQLLGHLSQTPSTDCAPFAYDPDSGKPIAPCGAIANSLFNDTLTLLQGGSEIKLLKTGIAWPSDKRVKFRNPEVTFNVSLEGLSSQCSWKIGLADLNMEMINVNPHTQYS